MHDFHQQVNSQALPSLSLTVELSGGPTAVQRYCDEVGADTLIHTWDLARAVGADERLPADLVDDEIADAQQRVCDFLDLDISALWQWEPDGAALVMTALGYLLVAVRDGGAPIVAGRVDSGVIGLRPVSPIAVSCISNHKSVPSRVRSPTPAKTE